MNPNPYQAPSPGGPQYAASNRLLFVLAGVGAWLASAYWAALTLLLAFGTATGTVSPLQLALPVVLIVLYAMRGLQLFKGDPAAARRILWLHGVGAVMALVQMSHGGTLWIVLQGIKIAIHVFGGLTAYLAVRSSS